MITSPRFDVNDVPLGDSVRAEFTAVFALPAAYGCAVADCAVAVSAELSAHGGLVSMRGEGVTELVIDCALCLEPVKVEVRFPLNEDFTREPQKDGDCYLIEGKTLDLTLAVENNLFLHIPMKVVCADNCSKLYALSEANEMHELNEQEE